ncbi:MarR family transcriptional regulator [Phototrophicus methaneseepsis]|uniref:MarR family transcriptional regulator n=1 Tax=Phototrophicus methaneseepsis TaxID=2710758 RepID=A0A7S8IFV6_9CHLR|nr:MarR family transcriptional regulator [Phototrophicus methaneseepsis]QPC84016.1 MarR family transcriptional regulator [Phototrophicus methaneseepsis]
MAETWDSHEVARHMLALFPKFRRAMTHHNQVVNDASIEEDTTLMQGFTLIQLIDEPMTVSDLARKRHVSLQAASTLVQVLVERGWIERVRKPDDRRQYLLQATDEGLARAEEMKQNLLEHTAKYFQGLTKEEIAAAQVFLPALERIIEERVVEDARKCR